MSPACSSRPSLVRQFLHVPAEVRLHLLGQLEALVLFQHPGEAALADCELTRITAS
jgi:hypothetical protein